MEDNFNNRDFEQFVKQNADQYRMYPSDKFWNGIHNSLHTRRRWFGLGLALLLLTTGTVTWIMMDSASRNKPIAATEPAPLIIRNTVTPALVNNISLSPVKHDNKNRNSNIPIISTGNLFIADRIAEPGNGDYDFTSSANVSKLADNPSGNFSENPAMLVTRSDKSVSAPKPGNPLIQLNTLLATRHSATRNKELNQFTDSHLLDKKTENIVSPKPEFTISQTYPLTIESVVNNYKYRKNRSKMSFEVFVTPTISYRKLADNEAFLNAAARSNNTTSLNYISVADINSVVTHKPDVGIEVGFTTGYPVARNLKLTVGLQLNVSKYDIRAYSHPPEMATIALNTGGSTANSVSAITSYRNLNVSNSNWLQNLYVSASMPLGAEFKFARARNTYIGIGATVQPTYILSDHVYLISTDYKNYAEVPSLMRHWNVNTSFSTFIGYTLGHMKWRIGPQVRYQMMSSFQDKYPVKEHLFDYGLKLGLMLR